MKIAVVRGPSLNKFEMQYYEPLARKYDIVCFSSTKPVYDIAGVDLPIVRLPCLGQVFGFIPGAIKLLNNLFGDPQGLIGLEGKLSGFDVVHTAETYSYYTHQALLAKSKGRVKRVVATISENIPFLQEEQDKVRRLKSYARRNLDHFLAISNYSKRSLMIEGLPEEKISVVPHGLDCQIFSPGEKDRKLAESLGIDLSLPVILSVGRLVWEKGMECLFLAGAKLLQERVDFQILIVGQGPQKEYLKFLVKRIGVPEKQVIFTPSFPYEEMPKIYRLADIFVLASIPTPEWQEQFGMVLIEAMACGIPVVSTSSGAIKETIGNAGVLVLPSDYLALAMTIQDLLKSSDLCKGLLQKGRKRAIKLFSAEKIAEKIDKVYQTVNSKH